MLRVNRKGFMMSVARHCLAAAVMAGACGHPVAADNLGALPANHFWFGGHVSQYHSGSHEPTDDFLDNTTLPGLQAGYRFRSDWSIQAWWERHRSRREQSDDTVNGSLSLLSLRYHFAEETGSGLEPYIGSGAGRLTVAGQGQLMLSLELGVQRRIRPDWVLDIGVRTPYSVDDRRLDGEAYIAVQHIVGWAPASDANEDQQDVPVVAPEPVLRDSDHDGIADTVDECPGTPAGSRVDQTGCPAR
jgi:OOP family OmpA-OmpF porin